MQLCAPKPARRQSPGTLAANIKDDTVCYLKYLKVLTKKLKKINNDLFPNLRSTCQRKVRESNTLHNEVI